MSTPRGFLCTTGKAPSGDGECEFLFAKAKLNHYLQYGPAHKYHEANLVCEVLKDPITIFEGLARDGMEGGLCYCGKPLKRYLRTEGATAPPPPGMLFAVYMTCEKKIFEWRWEKEDGNNPGYPIEAVRQRFGQLIWKRSQSS